MKTVIKGALALVLLASTAQVAFAHGRVSLHAGDLAAARVGFAAALEQLRAYEQSLLAGNFIGAQE